MKVNLRRSVILVTINRQEKVRRQYVERLIREKQTYISKQTGIPAPVLSLFKAGKKNLYDESLEKLENYLNN